ncbi:hypothetical protein HanRHA438_Chr09g0410081 [Helianthus annuus]|nr:hypothetical protein HanIR_Chr09g0429211 [Helianthus annuus]KAJ0889180.1 hypothetical protein HanRHA438_Chr09g0410081 [Helianthus annuus]
MKQIILGSLQGILIWIMKALSCGVILLFWFNFWVSLRWAENMRTGYLWSSYWFHCKTCVFARLEYQTDHFESVCSC